MNSLAIAGGKTRPLAGLWIWLAGVWLLVTVATPISLWLGKEELFPRMAAAGVLAQSAAVLMVLAQNWQSERILRASLLILAFTWLVEWAGVTSGSPFGEYAYTTALQPQVGNIPVIIPLAWLMMLFPAWGVAETILSNWRQRLGRGYLPAFAVLSGLAFSAWDLYLDPMMTARGLWFWVTPSGYFGIPWQNYFGWWGSAFILTLVVRPQSLPHQPMIAVYGITWVFQAVGLGVFWSQPGPAVAGFLGMGVFAVLAWLRMRSLQGSREGEV